MTVDEEATMVALLRPSPQELASIEAGINHVLKGIVRTKDGWQVDPDLQNLVQKHGPEQVLQVAKRGLRVVKAAEVIMAQQKGAG